MLELLHAAPAIATLIIFLITGLAFIFKPVFIVFITGLIVSLLLLIYSMIDSIKLYKDIKPAMLLPFVMPAQIIGYGFGFIFNFIRRVIFGKGEQVGFKSTYYK